MGPGGGSQESLKYGWAPTRNPTPYPLYTISDRKGTPFVYLPLTMQNGINFTYTRETLHPLLRNWPFFLYSEER